MTEIINKILDDLVQIIVFGGLSALIIAARVLWKKYEPDITKWIKAHTSKKELDLYTSIAKAIVANQEDGQTPGSQKYLQAYSDLKNQLTNLGYDPAKLNADTLKNALTAGVSWLKTDSGLEVKTVIKDAVNDLTSVASTEVK